jgi:hypothetical protein
LGLGTVIFVIIVILFILAIIGLGWQGFFGGVKKGADKLGITSIVTNLTDQFKNELMKRVGNNT